MTAGSDEGIGLVSGKARNSIGFWFIGQLTYIASVFLIALSAMFSVLLNKRTMRFGFLIDPGTTSWQAYLSAAWLFDKAPWGRPGIFAYRAAHSRVRTARSTK